MNKMLGIIRLGTRVMEILFSIIILGCSAYQLSSWYKLDGFGMALFSGLTGMMISVLMLAGPHFNTVLAERLPGLIDIILSGLWSIFFLAAGGAIASYGSCNNWGYSWAASILDDNNIIRNTNYRAPAAAVCGTWNATIAFCFFNFVLYGVSAVFAGLDLKAGKGMVKPRGFNAQAAHPSTDVEAANTKPAVDLPYPPQAATHVPRMAQPTGRM